MIHYCTASTTPLNCNSGPFNQGDKTPVYKGTKPCPSGSGLCDDFESPADTDMPGTITHLFFKEDTNVMDSMVTTAAKTTMTKTYSKFDTSSDIPSSIFVAPDSWGCSTT